MTGFYDYALASRALPVGVLVMTLLATRIGSGDLAEPDRDKAAKLERVMDEIREKLGSDAVIKGRSL